MNDFEISPMASSVDGKLQTMVTAKSKIKVADYIESLNLARDTGGCDLVFMSPPYDNARTYGNDISWSFEDYQRLGDRVFIALKPGGHCLMVLDGPVREWRKGKGTERSFTPWRVMLDWAERMGFRMPDRLVYGRHGVPGAYRGRFRNDFEMLLWFQKPGSIGFFNKWDLTTPAIYPGYKHLNKARKPDGTQDVRRNSGKAFETGVRHRGTYWDYGDVGHRNDEASAEQTGHPARFCVRFAEDVVRCFCPPDGLVCDPFVGSGTTAVASVRHGRYFVGGDLYRDEHEKPWALWAHERVLVEIARKQI